MKKNFMTLKKATISEPWPYTLAMKLGNNKQLVAFAALYQLY